MSITPKLWGIMGGAIVFLALLVALFATRATLADEKRHRAAAEAELAVAQSSTKRLTVELKRVMTEQARLALDDAARVRAAREAQALVEAASKARMAAIERLEASAGIERTKNTSCEFSAAAMETWQ